MSADEVYASLRAAIASGQLHPNERLVEADLVTRYATSRFIVRSALLRLVQEGIVEHERNRGARVRLVDEHEAVEVYETRSRLEGLAAAKAAERATEAQIADLRSLLVRIEERIDAGDLPGASNENAALHALIVEIADHATVSRIVSGLNSYLVRFQYRTMLHRERPQRSLREHAVIVHAIAAHDPVRAESAMRAHLENVTETLSRPIPTLE